MVNGGDIHFSSGKEFVIKTPDSSLI
jgi:hypothetical protein